MSIKNVAVLAAYLEINPLLELLPDLASQLSVTDFNLDDLKNAAAELPDMSVDGLKKFVEAGFGTTTKMRTGDKRKNQNVKKESSRCLRNVNMFVLKNIGLFYQFQIYYIQN